MSTTHTYKVKGMHCASCASIIERTVKKIEGVENIAVNNGTENAKISFDNSKTSPEDFNKKLEPLGYSLVVPQSHNMTAEVADMKTKVLSAIPLAIFAAFIMSWDILAQYGFVSEMSYVVKEFS